MRIIGIVLAIAGAIALAYGGFDYTRHHEVMQLGPLEITTSEHRTFPIPAVVGLIALVGGIVLLVSDTRSRRGG